MSDTNTQSPDIKRLSHNEDYYSNVFKRVEKLVSVILYILSHIDIKDNKETFTTKIQTLSFKVHEASLETLELQQQDVQTGLKDLQYLLVNLDSVFTVATAAQVIPQDLYRLVTEQIDGVQRYINNHYTKDSGFAFVNNDSVLPAAGADTQSISTKKVSKPVQKRARKVVIPDGDISSDAYLVYSQLTDRAERIKTVLEAKPQASIKDIAEIITDVSEKTIQRELNSLIEKGQVYREGERRWSKYSVVK